MAEFGRGFLALLVVATMPWFSGCTTVLATAGKSVAPLNIAEEQAMARVQYAHREGCMDRTTEVMQVDEVYRKADDWAFVRQQQGYVQPSTHFQAPKVRYPKSEVLPGVAEAVLVMIFINPDGTVQSSEPVCSTRSVFDRYAMDTVKQNRYSPGRLDGENKRGVAFQTIMFSTSD